MQSTGEGLLHIGIIPDGNRRYAKAKGKDFYSGYLDGIARLDALIETIGNRSNTGEDNPLRRIRMLTVFVCSTDNLTKRSSEEIKQLFSLFRLYFEKYNTGESLLHTYRVKVRIVGRLTLFPEDLQATFASIMKSTAEYDNYVLNLACGYDGHTEILDAITRAGHGEKSDAPNWFEKYLSVSEPMDLVIRTGKEQRMSGFFPWQTTYAEWFFLEIMWPEFTCTHLQRVLHQFNQRNRRFGQ